MNLHIHGWPQSWVMEQNGIAKSSASVPRRATLQRPPRGRWRHEVNKPFTRRSVFEKRRESVWPHTLWPPPSPSPPAPLASQSFVIPTAYMCHHCGASENGGGGNERFPFRRQIGLVRHAIMSGIYGSKRKGGGKKRWNVSKEGRKFGKMSRGEGEKLKNSRGEGEKLKKKILEGKEKKKSRGRRKNKKNSRGGEKKGKKVSMEGEKISIEGKEKKIVSRGRRKTIKRQKKKKKVRYPSRFFV